MTIVSEFNEIDTFCDWWKLRQIHLHSEISCELAKVSNRFDIVKDFVNHDIEYFLHDPNQWFDRDNWIVLKVFSRVHIVVTLNKSRERRMIVDLDEHFHHHRMDLSGFLISTNLTKSTKEDLVENDWCFPSDRFFVCKTLFTNCLSTRINYRWELIWRCMRIDITFH